MSSGWLDNDFFNFAEILRAPRRLNNELTRLALATSKIEYAGPTVTHDTPARIELSDTEHVKRVLEAAIKLTDDFLADEFNKIGRTYEIPHLDLTTETNGPVYFPNTKRVVIPPRFFKELQLYASKYVERITLMYVVAHETAHHVQNLMGMNENVLTFEHKIEKNTAFSVLELHADCVAGMMMNALNRKKTFFHKGDPINMMVTAAALGDDLIQLRGGLTVNKADFKHGTAVNRMTAVARGLMLTSLAQLPSTKEFIAIAKQ